MIKNNIKQTYGENTTFDFKKAVERKQPKSWLKSTDVFTQFGYMEKRGSGLRKIRNETAKLPGFTNEKRPTLRSQYESFFTEILNNNYGGEVQGETQDVLQSETDKSFDLWIEKQIKKDPWVTTKKLTELCGKSAKTIKRHIATMAHITYVGVGKNGHWEVLSSHDVPRNVPRNVPQDGSINGSEDVSVNDDVVKDVAKDVAQNVAQNVAVKSKKQ